MDTVSERIDRIVDEFVDLDGREKLELLLDFANRLPPLSADHQARKQQEDRRVHECQTAVYLWPEVADGTMTLVAEVAELADLHLPAAILSRPELRHSFPTPSKNRRSSSHYRSPAGISVQTR